MSQSRKFHLLVAAWIATLLFIAGTKQYAIYTGQKILLEVMPVDPRHPFMGAYARLNYKISTPPVDLSLQYEKGRRVFVSLAEKEGVWEAVLASDSPPENGALYIRGIATTPPITNYVYKVELEDFADILPEGWVAGHPEQIGQMRKFEHWTFPFSIGQTAYIVVQDWPETPLIQRLAYVTDRDKAIQWFNSQNSGSRDRDIAVISAKVASLQVDIKHTLHVRYGIEKYFATEQKALEYERMSGQGRILVEAYVTSGGDITLGELIIRPEKGN